MLLIVVPVVIFTALLVKNVNFRTFVIKNEYRFRSSNKYTLRGSPQQSRSVDLQDLRDVNLKIVL